MRLDVSVKWKIRFKRIVVQAVEMPRSLWSDVNGDKMMSPFCVNDDKTKQRATAMRGGHGETGRA